MQQIFTYIGAIASTGSFSKAAEELCITQPALSIAIGKEEKRIGLPLFDRSTHPIVPTDAGRAYLETIRRLKLEEESLANRINDIQNLDGGSVRIGGSHYLNAYILAPMLSAFSEKNPKIKISLEEQGSDVLSRMLKGNELDVTFSCNINFMADFERYPLFSDHLLLAVPKDNPFNKSNAFLAFTAEDVMQGRHLEISCPVLSFTSLVSLPLVLLRPGNNLYDRSMGLFHSLAMQPQVKLLVSQLVTAYRLAQAGFAATIVCDRLVRESSPLCFYKLGTPLAERRFYLLVAGRGYTSHALSAFIHFATKWFKDC